MLFLIVRTQVLRKRQQIIEKFDIENVNVFGKKKNPNRFRHVFLFKEKDFEKILIIINLIKICFLRVHVSGVDLLRFNNTCSMFRVINWSSFHNNFFEVKS